MTEDNNSQTLFLKKYGTLLKEKGVKVQPLPEATDVVETILVDKDNLLKAGQLLKDEIDAQFDLLISVSAVDKIKEGLIESVYHLFSTKYLNKLILKVQVPREKATIPSVVSLWPTADWHEREAYDLMGVVYSGHPELKRILLPMDWIGHPLRKDYVLEDERLKWNER